MSEELDFTYWIRFLNELVDAEESLGGLGNNWYRGHSKADYQLIPSLFRYPDGMEKEKALFEKFKQISTRIFPERKSDWEILFDMQHYFIPTRLLDWTDALSVAIFFALLQTEKDESAIFILDPLKLNSKSKKYKVLMVNEEKNFDYKKIYWDKEPIPPNHPIAIEAPFQNERIVAQKGKFTISSDDSTPLEDKYPDCVKKVILPIDTIDGAKEFLRHSGINEFSIFPDIVGLAPFIKNIVDLKEP